MAPSVFEYLRHIFDETEYLLNNSSELTRERLIFDETLRRAFVRSLEIIGEAVKQIPEDTKRKYASLEWRAIAGMRDKLIHAYFGVDYDIVWDVVIHKIPELHEVIKQMINDEGE